MDSAARYPHHASIRLPATLRITYVTAAEEESSENLMESMAKVDIVVKAPSNPVPTNKTLSSLIMVPAAMAPKRTPSRRDPTRFTPNVAYGAESVPAIDCMEYLRTAPMAPPSATSASSLESMGQLGIPSFSSLRSFLTLPHR